MAEKMAENMQRTLHRGVKEDSRMAVCWPAVFLANRRKCDLDQGTTINLCRWMSHSCQNRDRLNERVSAQAIAY